MINGIPWLILPLVQGLSAKDGLESIHNQELKMQHQVFPSYIKLAAQGYHFLNYFFKNSSSIEKVSQVLTEAS